MDAASGLYCRYTVEDAPRTLAEHPEIGRLLRRASWNFLQVATPADEIGEDGGQPEENGDQRQGGRKEPGGHPDDNAEHQEAAQPLAEVFQPGPSLSASGLAMVSRSSSSISF